jgi:hypothetical protein
MTPPTSSATIPGVPHLFVQEEKAAVYKLLKAAHASILPEDTVQLLLDDASTKVCTITRGAFTPGLTLDAYTAR